MPVRPPELAQTGKPDAAEAQRILEQFRRSGIKGQYFLKFELRTLPRRGVEAVYSGQWWGARNERGAITRVELIDGSGVPRRFLAQNGEQPALWRFVGAKVEQVGVGGSFEPLLPGIEITAFDVQMPYLYWPEATLEKLERVRGRPAYAYLFRAPGGLALPNSDVGAARGFLDTQYNALMQTELLSVSGRVLKTMTLLDLKKIVDPRSGAEQWIPKSFDLRNETTRDKTRFIVGAAALDQEFPAVVFEPASLAQPAPPAAQDRMVRIP